MEQAQLFKRLFDMSLDEIASFIDYYETIEASLYKLDISAGKNPMAAQLACIELEKQLTFMALTG